MKLRALILALSVSAASALTLVARPTPAEDPRLPHGQQPDALTVKHATDTGRHPDFRTSDRCVACHNGMKTGDGEVYSIGVDWRGSIMANTARDPYWQGSIRRESIDHPESSAKVQNECSVCHMPLLHLEDRQRGRLTHVFENFPIQKFPHGNRSAADGVTCAVCHQIQDVGLGGPESFNGNVTVAAANPGHIRPEYGPYDTDLMHQNIMMSSTGGFQPLRGDHMRDAGLCGSCHTLYTDALGPGGKIVGRLPEQMPFLEWQHSAYSTTQKQTCQQCHMPEVKGPTPITVLYGQTREGARHHTFVGANFFMQGILGEHRDDLAVEATADEMTAAKKETEDFLQTRAATVSIANISSTGPDLVFDVTARNLGGHKLPTAYPSRRAWLHVTVRDANGRIVFESGRLNPDGSIAGNANDQDPTRFEPHHPEITRPEQVEIYEDILHDMNGKVTTGILAATGYLKDNRLLPEGFDKSTAVPDIAVVGEAAQDPGFTDHGSTVRYHVNTGGAGPLRIQAELFYQPIGFRWAHNLQPYPQSEPQRMVKYFDEHPQQSAIILAHAEAGRQ